LPRWPNKRELSVSTKNPAGVSQQGFLICGGRFAAQSTRGFNGRDGFSHRQRVVRGTARVEQRVLYSP
jgi:hypothetical protein